MKVVVLGGNGKVGQWVVRDLAAREPGAARHEVVVFDRSLGDAPRGVRQIAGDVLDLGHVVEALEGADAVVHLAAIPRPGVVPDEVLFRVNALGTFNVHEAARCVGVKRVVTVSSQAILGWDYRTRDFPPEYLPVDENHPVQPQDVYGLSKEVSEAIARSYSRRGLETVVLRPNYVVTPDELAQLTANGGRNPERFLLFGYVDARDFASAVRLSVERPVPTGSVLFIVADDSCVAEPLSALLPRLMPVVGNTAEGLTGEKSAISNARAKEILDWQPRHSWRRTESVLDQPA